MDTTIVVGTKICSKCKTEKDLSCFHKDRNSKDGLNYRCKECISAYDRAYGRSYRSPELDRRDNLRYLYGLAVEDYNDLLRKQNFVCAICKREETIVYKDVPRRLSVDHNRLTGKVRGLLCSNCNQGLGRFKDNIDSLKEAVKYLEVNQ